MLRSCLQAEAPVPEALHNRMRTLLLQYAVIGGMPEAVPMFADTKQPGTVLSCSEILSALMRTT